MARGVLDQVSDGFSQIVRIDARDQLLGQVEAPVEPLASGRAFDYRMHALDDLGDISACFGLSARKLAVDVAS